MVERNSTIVTRGFVVKTQATTIHGIEMDPDIVRVEVIVVINPFVELLIPINDEIYLVKCWYTCPMVQRISFIGHFSI